MKEITINNIKYPISFVDTQDTVRNMIAVNEATQRKFIKFLIFNPVESDIQIELLKDKVKGVPIIELEQLLQDLEDWNLNKTDVALEWLRVNRGGKVDNYDFDLLDTFKRIDSTDFWGLNAIETAYQQFLKDTQEEIKTLEQESKKEQSFRSEYNKYNPIETTSFLQDSVIIEYQMTIKLDPLAAFNSLNLNEQVPFARLKGVDQIYYKLLNDLNAPKNWLEGDATLTFKISGSGDIEDWGTATINYINVDESGSPYNVVMTIESSVGGREKKGTSEEEIKSSILSVFTDADINIISREEKGIKGVFAIPEVTLSRDVFLDLITNEELVSHYLYVDETRELSSQKGVLYLYFAPGDAAQDILTVFLSERKVSRNDPFYQNKELLLFTPYLNVRVSRANNLNQINRFREAFAIILDVYRKKFDSIANIYNDFIPGFKTVNAMTKKRTAAIEGKNIRALQLQDPELFVHGYPTKCEKKKQPVPIKEEDIPKMGKKQVMNYPKGSNNYFICTDTIWKYPGLIKNKLDNSDQFEYLPCCYKVNQKEGNKTLNIYLQDLDRTEKTKTGNIVTKMAVEFGKLGYLPRNIYYILSKNLAKGEEFLRYGVPIGNNSFISTILLALDPEYQKVQDKGAYVQDFRNNLASQDMSAVIQQLYDVEPKQFVKDILNPAVPFDSKLYIGLLENYYNCNIIVFERSEDDPNGSFEIPRYTQGYVYEKFNTNKITVLVYKHFGSRSDNLQTPHYELIIKRYKKNITLHFDNTNLLRTIYSYFLRSYQLYLIGLQRYKPTELPATLIADIQSQRVDRYGKTRGYNFEKNIYLALSPLAPSADLIVEYQENVDRPTQADVLNFIKRHGLEIIAQDISENQTVGFAINLAGVDYAYLPCKPSTILSGVPQRQNLGFSVPSEDDILETSLRNRKIADFMMQLLLYSFSLWYSEHPKRAEMESFADLPLAVKQSKEQALLMNMIELFLQEQIVVIPDHDYKVRSVPRRLSINNSFFVNDKLVADSPETYSRLSYYLRFMAGKNRALVIKYSEKLYLDNYYTYGADFEQRPGQLIFIGNLGITNWLDSQSIGISNHTYKVPNPNIREPFFFSHWALNGGKPVLIQNVFDGEYKRALAVAARYIRDGINIGFNARPIKPIAHTTFFFEDRLLMRDGTSPVTLWRYGPDYYAAIIIP